MCKDGLPKALGPMLPLLRHPTPESLKFCLTLLTLGRGLKLPLSPDYSGIVDPPKCETGFSAVSDFVKANTSRIEWKLLPWEKFHFSSKAGPNGPATLSCMEDLKYLPDTLRDNLSILTDGEIDPYIEDLSQPD